MDESTVYPSMNDLCPEPVLNRLPYNLVQRIKERYEALGGKYVLPFPEYSHGGKPVNSCMVNDSVQLTEEEIVDAAFNLLVLLLKQRNVDVQPEEDRMEITWNTLLMTGEVFSNLMVLKSGVSA